MNKLPELLARRFPGPAKGARYRNEIRKVTDNKYVWRTTEASLPCATENFRLKHPNNTLHKVEIKNDWSISLYSVGSGNVDESVKPTLLVNGKPLAWGEKAPKGVDLELVIEGASEQVTAQEAVVKEGPPMLQSVEVLGEKSAVWKIKFQNPTNDLSALFPQTASTSENTAEANASDKSVNNSTTSASSGVTGGSGFLSSRVGSLFSNITGQGATAAASASPSRYYSSETSETSPEISESGLPTKLVSTPFRLHHVLLGDFWLEFLPHSPTKNYGSIFFKMGYPDLAVRVQLELLSGDGNAPAFTKQFVSLGRSTVHEDINAGAFLPVNFGLSQGWAGDGEIKVKATLLELVKVPAKLRGVV